MTSSYSTEIDAIYRQASEMERLVTDWANINSNSENLPGLSNMLSALQAVFVLLGGEMQVLSLPPMISINNKGLAIEKPLGKALRIVKHREAPIQILLAGHMDTVYPIDSHFQLAAKQGSSRLHGPGVADMKGGLVILFKALQTLEQSRFAGKIGWEVLINPDEEIGSLGSEQLFIQAAHKNHLGLLFEPSLSDGALVSARKGSANYTVVARGRAAHAGRDFHEGRNAIVALSRLVIEAEKLTDIGRGITVNVGFIEGGGPVNIVPDLAICRINVRVINPDDITLIRESLHHLVAEALEAEGINVVLYEQTVRMPKLFDRPAQELFNALNQSAIDLGQQPLQSRPSGGACDGNILAHEGLPTIDSLGAIGGAIHTPEEYIHLDSLANRAALITQLLFKLADEKIEINTIREAGQ